MTTLMINVRQGVLIAFGAMFAVAAATAADTPASNEVTVQAQRSTATVVGRDAASGAPVVLASVDYRVNHSDLDLSIPSNAKALKTRVRDAARAACSDLNKLYEISTNGSNECSQKAEERAMPQVLSAIAAAEARKTAAD
jgi:UrcA family protein